MDSLKHILRRLARTPGFTAIAILTLALGIGANTAIFSVVNGVLIKPLPYPAPEALIGVWHKAPGIPGFGDHLNLAPTMYFTYGEQNQTFQEFGLWSLSGASITGKGEPELVQSLYVTPGALNALGVQPILGRWFSKADGEPSAEATVMLTYGYWQRRLGGDKAVLGTTLTIDGKPRSIIGVMPQDFRFLTSVAEVILPHQFDRNKLFLGNFSYQGIARLKPGATLERANSDVARMLPLWMKSWPVPPGLDKSLFENAGIAPAMQPLKQDVVGDVGSVLWVLMGTIGLVLLIACANVANLLLVRAEGRQQELAIRAALGASWGSIAREMLVESLLLGALGGAAGLGLAYAGLKALVAIGPQTLPRLDEIGIDPLVLAFAPSASLLAALLFGIVPVLKHAAPRLAVALRAGGRGMSHSRERLRARNVLVVTQVALALVLLISSGLMIRTFDALRRIQPGFSKPEEVQLVRVFIPEPQVKEPDAVMRMEQQMTEKIAAIPGVQSAAFGSAAPLEGFNSNDAIWAEDKVYRPDVIPPIRRYRFIAPGYIKTLGTRLLAGREFTWTEMYERRYVALISNNVAKELWGSAENALGKRIRNASTSPWREIVGVVDDVYDNGVHQAAATMVYWPALQDKLWGQDLRPQRSGVFVFRSNRAGTESLMGEVRQAIWSVNSTLPLALVRTLKEVYDQSMARTSFTLVMLAIAGGMALVLGIIGIYGVISYTVSQRTREIGIRMALGAEHSVLKTMFVRHGLLLAAIGIVIGLAAAAGLAQWMKSLLYGIAPLDPVTYVAVPVMLALAVAAASYIPARRAVKVDPTEALRAD